VKGDGLMRLRSLIAIAAISPAVGATPDPLRLPLTFLGNNPMTSIEVAGHETEVVVDTGGGVLALSRETLTRAGAVELSGKPAIWTDANGQAHEARRFRVPEIRVGGRLFANLEAIEAQTIPNGPPVPNAIGREFLRQFIVLMDYSRRTMTLLSAKTAEVAAEAMGCQGTRVPFEQTSAPGLAITRVKLDGATLRLVWDTGATYSSLSARVISAHRLSVAPAVGTRPPFYNTQHLVMGGSDFGPLEFVVLPLELPGDFDGMLGYNVFAKHVVCLNYGRSELRVS